VPTRPAENRQIRVGTRCEGVGEQPRIAPCLTFNTARLKVNHANNHRSARIKWKILKTPFRVKGAHLIVDRMGEHAKAAYVARSSQRRSQREFEQRAGITFALMIFVDGKLTEQRRRHRIRLVALLQFGQKAALDLSGAQSHKADDFGGSRVADHIRARDALDVIVPGMTLKPSIQGSTPAIESRAIVVFG